MLTEITIRAAKAGPRARKLFDERGLYLFVTPAGSRLWRLKYRFGGSEKLLALGAYPEVSLKLARDRRDDARRQLADNRDPGAERKAQQAAQGVTFEAVAREHLALQRKAVSDGTVDMTLRRLERYVFPKLGGRPIADIAAAELLSVLRVVEARGIHEMAHRLRAVCGRVFRYAIATGRAQRDVAADLRGALAPVKATNLAAITEPAKIGELLRAIDNYQGQQLTLLAMKLAPLVFVRPGELRHAEWKEFDLARAEWRIAGERMKMREPHLVPLSQQALALIRQIATIKRSDRYVFPSLLSVNRPMSENCITTALRRMGYAGDEMTWHGFRSLASTSLNEQGWHPDLIELQLAHAERNKVRAAYNRAERLAERRQMMQAWADYLDGLRIGNFSAGLGASSRINAASASA